MDKEKKLVVIGNYCKIFRSEILGLTLQEFEALSGIKMKTISSFEHGKSTNILHVLKYMDIFRVASFLNSAIRFFFSLANSLAPKTFGAFLSVKFAM